MKIVKSKDELITELSRTEDSVRRSLQKLKDYGSIHNFSVMIVDKYPKFTVFCSVILLSSRSLCVEFQYKHSQKKNFFASVDRARHIVRQFGRSFLKPKTVYRFLRKEVRERERGYKNEDRVECEFLPRLKSEGIVLGFKKTKGWVDKNGSDFEIKIASASGGLRKILFELKSSRFYQELHASKYPKKSSIAIHRDTSYEEFRALILILITTVRSGRRAVLYDKKCA